MAETEGDGDGEGTEGAEVASLDRRACEQLAGARPGEGVRWGNGFETGNFDNIFQVGLSRSHHVNVPFAQHQCPIRLTSMSHSHNVNVPFAQYM